VRVEGFAEEVAHARGLGLSREGLHRLRSLVEQRQRNAWDIGDALVAMFGPPVTTGGHDGSYERFESLGEELGVSASWLSSCRACAAAWPPSERKPSVCWSCHRRLAAEPERFRLLAEFRADCARKKLTPSHKLLVDWMDARRVTRPAALGRPPTDPVTRLERLALRLDHDALVLLVARLTALLSVPAVT
jgi:hypothetical protein